MKSGYLFFAALIFTTQGQADFSYKITRKTGGMMSAIANQGPQTSNSYYKGQKIRADNGSRSTILDFDAQTVTTIDNGAKTYAVKSFSDFGPASGSEIQADVKETGQKKMIGG